MPLRKMSSKIGPPVLLLVLGVALYCAGQTTNRTVRVWLIPAENAGPNDIAQAERIPAELDGLRLSLQGTGVRLLNVEDPLAMKARTWNPQFNVPNFQILASQKKTFEALQTFSKTRRVGVIIRLVTWDEAFGLLSAGAKQGPDALPDVAQIGSSWAGYFAGRGAIRSRPDWATNRGNWQDVLDVKAGALPFANDVRLLFYWKRLPTAEPTSKPLQLNNSDWKSLLESLRVGTQQGETIVIPIGVTLNLLHDFFPLVWAGTNKKLISTGPLGASIDLTSRDALNVPSYIASQTRIPVPGGESRRLVSFPESSHEEATRTFVNGGYRGTLEPANFIGRWYQDFEERQDLAEKQRQMRKHFWDYAAAVGPPANFKGGSELVVLSGTRDPQIAAALADYLATDPSYTKVLADAGHLPAGQPGYGIKELMESFSGEPDASSVQKFSEAVQKAIDQGVRYPDLEQWPLVVENHEVLELLQRVWRRMAEGDVQGMREAAGDVQSTINSRIYLPAKTWESIQSAWPLLLAIAFCLGAYAVNVRAARSRSLRNLITILHLYRASRHESAKILGDNLLGMHEMARVEGVDSEHLMRQLLVLGEHYSGQDGLAAYMAQLSDDLVLEVQGARSSSTVLSVVQRAFKGARLFFEAWNLMEWPQVTFVPAGLVKWNLRPFPAIATVVLQEWLFNCIKDVAPGSSAVITVEAKRGELIITSPGHLTEEQLATLTGQASRGFLKANASGLVLIRDICHHAFHSKARVRQLGNEIQVTIPLNISEGKQ